MWRTIAIEKSRVMATATRKEIVKAKRIMTAMMMQKARVKESWNKIVKWKRMEREIMIMKWIEEKG